MIKSKPLLHALALAKHGKFTRAAAESHISQSAFSRSIRNLEKELGVVLFDRDANNVVPTGYGKALLQRASIIVADTEELEREIRLLQGLETGTFSIALGIYPAEVSGNQALGKMVLEHPNLRYRISSGNWQHVNQQVLSRNVDLGFAETSVADKNEKMTTENVSQNEMVLYCRKNHPLAGCTSLTRADLDQFPLVSIRVPARMADSVPGKAELDQSNGFLVPAVEIDDFLTARAIIANSNGFGVAIPTQIESQLEAGEFTLLDYPSPWLNPPLGFIFLRNRTVSPAAEVFMDIVVDVEKKISKRSQMLIDKYRK